MKCEAHYGPTSWGRKMWRCAREAVHKLHGIRLCREHYHLLRLGKPWPQESFDEHDTLELGYEE